MRVEVINHPSGDQLPILLDDDGLPLPMPSEFVLGRRALGTNTLIRNLRELSALYEWIARERIDLSERISTGKAFTEAELRGGLIESLRRDHSKGRKVKRFVITPNTFNQRLTTVRQYLGLLFDIHLGSIPYNDMRYERIRDQKMRTISWLDSSFINAPPINASKQKGLTLKQAKFLVSCLDPENDRVFGRDPAVRFRNYVSVMIMLNYGLRPGELLSLKVSDIEFGAISAIRITRRPPDQNDKRSPRPHIKRNGRVLPIDNPIFARHINEYIMKWRDVLEAKSDKESEYLILSDEGDPLSQPSMVQFFQLIRKRFPDELPANLSAKSLRHTFSSNMERVLREVGMDEERRAEALAELRGDSSLSSQSVYIAQEIQEQANLAMRNYHNKLLG
jgi:integrase